MKLKLFGFILLTMGMAGASSAQETANPSAPHALLVNFGFTAGGMALGADYEHAIHRTFGIGGFLRLYPDNDDSQINRSSINAFGAFIRPHFTRQAWDFYVSPGFGIIQYERQLGANTTIDETMMGPVMMIGLLYQLSNAVALGIEQTSIYGWFGDEDTRGQLSEEALAKFRFSF